MTTAIANPSTGPFAPEFSLSIPPLSEDPQSNQILNELDLWVQDRWSKYGLVNQAKEIVRPLWQANNRLSAEDFIRHMEIVLVHDVTDPQSILDEIEILKGAVELVKNQLSWLPAYRKKANSPLLDMHGRSVAALYEEAALTVFDAREFMGWAQKIDQRLYRTEDVATAQSSRQILTSYIERSVLRLPKRGEKVVPQKPTPTVFQLSRNAFVGEPSAYIRPSGVQMGVAHAALGRLRQYACKPVPQK